MNDKERFVRAFKTKEGAKNIVLACLGCFAPVHGGHVAVLERAKVFMTSQGFHVAGGLLIPISQTWVDNKITSFHPAQEPRVKMLDAALSLYDWITFSTELLAGHEECVKDYTRNTECDNVYVWQCLEHTFAKLKSLVEGAEVEIVQVCGSDVYRPFDQFRKFLQNPILVVQRQRFPLVQYPNKGPPLYYDTEGISYCCDYSSSHIRKHLQNTKTYVLRFSAGRMTIGEDWSVVEVKASEKKAENQCVAWETFRVEELEIKSFDKWILTVHWKQVMLGSCVLILKRHLPNLAGVSPEEWVEFGAIISQVEMTLRKLFKCEKVAYMALMFFDSHVHFHIIPRFTGTRNFAGREWTDKYQPDPLPQIVSDPAATDKEMIAVRDAIREALSK